MKRYKVWKPGERARFEAAVRQYAQTPRLKQIAAEFRVSRHTTWKAVQAIRRGEL